MVRVLYFIAISQSTLLFFLPRPYIAWRTLLCQLILTFTGVISSLKPVTSPTVIPEFLMAETNCLLVNPPLANLLGEFLSKRQKGFLELANPRRFLSL